MTRTPTRMRLAARDDRVLVLIGTWVVLYLPYILLGGLVRDDLGFVTTALDFPDYPAFQAYMSSFLTMTARPASALLHGACYWIFGSSAWPYHLVNLSLFLASVLLVYAAIRAALSPELGFLTAALALVYPCASGTVFSSIMMNSNLAGLCWGAALYLDAVRPAGERGRWRAAAVTILLLASALSYEAFIPLFAANLLLAMARSGGARTTWRRALGAVAPVGSAVLLLLVYRVLLEPLIFATDFSRMQLPDAGSSALAVKTALGRGITVAFRDSIRISARALTHLGDVSPIYLAVLVPCSVGLGVFTCRCIRSAEALRFRTPWLDERLGRLARAGRDRGLRLDLLALAALLFLLAQGVYVFSGYLPDPRGFESRTQGGVRFAWSFLLAVGLVSLYRLTARRWWRLAAITASLCLMALFVLSIVVQRDAWIAAAQRNDMMLRRMDRLIRGSGLDTRASLTVVAELPSTFPKQVNEEPTFGVPWDIGPALSLLYPDTRIRANVYDRTGTTVRPDGIEIHGGWQARYPFYLYRFSTDRIYPIRSSQDLSDALTAS